jgi:YcdC-like protein, C-terminal region
MNSNTYTAAEKRDEARREAKMRERVFGDWVQQGRMSKDKAARLIAMMWEIATDYDELAKKDRLL